MQYRYRVLGKVEQSFILRGAYFAVGSEIDFHITESELPFVKEMCKLTQICDKVKTTKPKNSMSNVASGNTKEQGSTAQKELVQENVQPKAELPSKRQYNKRSCVSNK